jgi:phosphoglycerate dehydrogenase-like enzyme
VARAGAGLDNVDVEACRRRNVVVLNTPDANTRAVVEFVTCFMLDALRPRVYLDKALDTKAWKGLRSDKIAPRQLSDLILGIVGMGKIGKQMARVGAAFNMRVFYYDIVEIPDEEREGALWLPRAALFRNADVVSIHVDGRAENRGIIDSSTLAECKPDVLFINTSRGFVVDNAALASFLRANPQALAMLDVHEPEPFGAEYLLLGLPNARLTPHLASATKTAHRNMSWVVEDLWAVLDPESAISDAE